MTANEFHKRSFWKVVIQRTFRGWWSRRLQVFQVEVIPPKALLLALFGDCEAFTRLWWTKEDGGFSRFRGVKTVCRCVVCENCGNFGRQKVCAEMCQTRRMDDHVAQMH